MTTTQLQYFVAATQLRRFSKAADRFYISQTAMTQQIRALEESVAASCLTAAAVRSR